MTSKIIRGDSSRAEDQNLAFEAREETFNSAAVYDKWATFAAWRKWQRRGIRQSRRKRSERGLVGYGGLQQTLKNVKQNRRESEVGMYEG